MGDEEEGKWRSITGGVGHNFNDCDDNNVIGNRTTSTEKLSMTVLLLLPFLMIMTMIVDFIVIPVGLPHWLAGIVCRLLTFARQQWGLASRARRGLNFNCSKRSAEWTTGRIMDERMIEERSRVCRTGLG